MCTCGVEWGSCHSIIGRYILQPLLIFHAQKKTKETWIIEIKDGPGREKKNGSFKLGGKRRNENVENQRKKRGEAEATGKILKAERAAFRRLSWLLQK